MKRKANIIGLIICGTLVLTSMFGCGSSKTEEIPSEIEELVTDEDGANVPRIDRVKAICELSTLKCYYHNLAKSKKSPGTGITHIGERERTFWIEYTGVAEISYRSELVKMEQEGKTITITLPDPVISCNAEQPSITEESYVMSEDSKFQKNPITPEDQTQAFREAQAKMEEEVKNNTALIASAELQAQELIENYIRQIGSVTDVEYTIIWK